MSVIRRRNEALAINAHKWEMWNVLSVTKYRDLTRTMTRSFMVGQTIYVATGYDFTGGRFVLQNPSQITVTSEGLGLSGKYTTFNSAYNQYMFFMESISEGETSISISGVYHYSSPYTEKSKGDTFGGYIYSADSDTYPDNNYVGDVWYVKVF